MKIELYFLIVCLPFLGQTQPAGMQRLNETVQSRWSDADAVPSCEGEVLFFSRSGHPENLGLANHSDVWISFKNANGSWSEAQNPGFPLNSELLEAPVGLSVDQNLLYISIRTSKALLPKLARCKRFGVSWSAPELIQMQGLFTTDTVQQLLLSANGNTLLAVVQRNGEGQVLVAQAKSDSVFEPFRELQVRPSALSTVVSASLAADGLTLYFVAASQKVSEVGVYRVVAKNSDLSTWTEPEPIFGLPDSLVLQTRLSVSADGQTLFLNYGYDQSDLYAWPIPNAYRPAKGVTLLRVCAREGQQPLSGAALLVYDASVSPPQPLFSSGKSGCASWITGQDKPLLVFGSQTGYFMPAMPLRLKPFSQQVPDLMPAKLITPAGNSKEVLRRKLIEVDTQLHALDLKRKVFRYMPLPTPPPSPKKVVIGKELESMRDMFQSYLDKKGTVPMDVSATGPAPDTSGTRKLAAAFADASGQPVLGPSSTVATDGVAPAVYKTERERLDALYNTHHGTAPTPKSVVAPPETASPKPQAATTWMDTELRKIWQNELKSELWQTMWIKMAAQYKEGLAPEDRARLPQAIDSVAAVLAAEAFPTLSDATAGPYEDSLRAEIRAGAKSFLKVEMETRAKAEMELEVEYQLLRLARAHLLQEMDKPPAAVAPTMGQPVWNKAAKPATVANAWVVLELVLPAYPLQQGAVIPLPGLVFAPDTDQLLPLSEVELQRLATWLSDQPEWQLEIASHTHLGVPADRALLLTAARARVVMQKLIGLGIDATRLRAVGLSNTKPLEREDSFSDMLDNERIEIRLIEVKK